MTDQTNRAHLRKITDAITQTERDRAADDPERIATTAPVGKQPVNQQHGGIRPTGH